VRRVIGVYHRGRSDPTSMGEHGSMNWSERRERFRALISGNRCVHPASVYDAISARIAEDLGFEIGMFSGSIGSMAVLGAPDLVVLTLTEFAAQANRICRAGNLALLVDADHGYGNALNVRRTVEELETAGICALSIEDTVLPRPYGPNGKPSLSSVEEGVGKMKAALSARQDPKLVIAGRTSALAIANLDEAVKRAKAYEAAGVDAVFLAGGVTVAAVEAVSQAISIPLILGGGGGELGDREWLAARRVRVALQTHAPFSAAVEAVYRTLKALRDGTQPRDLENIAAPEVMRRVTRADDYQRWTKDFLGGA
jgi:carboxyvinyl-carboxyphosphonate phosphorylmutase